MEKDTERFCDWAVNRGMLSESQALVLREISRPATSIDEFVELVEACAVVPDITPLSRLKDEMAAGLPGAPDATEGDTRAGPARHLPPDLQWFCHYCLADNLLTRDDCVSILANVEGTAGLIRFAQVLIDTGLCADHEKIRDLVKRAADQAAAGELAPDGGVG